MSSWQFWVLLSWIVLAPQLSSEMGLAVAIGAMAMAVAVAWLDRHHEAA